MGKFIHDFALQTCRSSRIFSSLMAMVNRAAKNKVKKGKKGKKQMADFDEDPYAQDAIEEQTAPAAVGFQEPAVEDAQDDLDWANDNKKGKKNKKGGNTESPAEHASPVPEQQQQEEGEFRILTKKEKEKLKKEKLKEQKRLAAIEKKQQQEAEDAEFNKALGLEDKKEQQDQEGGDAQPQQKSKKQLLKEKKAKKLAAKEAEPEAAPAVVEEPVAAPKGKKGKGGNVAALRVSWWTVCCLKMHESHVKSFRKWWKLKELPRRPSASVSRKSKERPKKRKRDLLQKRLNVRKLVLPREKKKE